VLLADAPTQRQLADWRSRYAEAAIVALLDDGDAAAAMAALEAGADAVLARTPTAAEIAAAIKAVAHGFAVLPRPLVALLREGTVLADALPARAEADAIPLTPRELEVLAAMADGASNKTIARRLGISFHTAKFHVAAILAKLDADTRTEAVAKAAQRGLVML
jgi:DNA-binding NarL/FixJ family response regulator